MERVRVKKIEIINFKGIEYLELDFTYLDSDRVLDNIVFYGINGSGKSTILEALQISLSLAYMKPIDSKFKIMEDIFINKFSLGEEWIYNKQDEFKINLQIIRNNILIDASIIYSQRNGLRWSLSNWSDIDFTNKNSIMEYLSSYRLFSPTKVSNAGDWNQIKEIEKGIVFNLENHTLSLQFGNSYHTVKQYLVNLITDKKVGVINDENIQILEKIKQAFKIFFPNKIFLEQLARSEMNQDYKFLIQNEDGTVVDIDQLSSGEREVIAFFTYLATKAMNVSILIIDEPELHLHDKWQSILLYAIHKLFPNVQLFLATHSETIHQSVSESELFELVK
jgi:predicted ATP-dependent endonuclease of OLD family